MKTDLLSEAFKKAKNKLSKAKDSIDHLQPTIATFLLVYSAQGVIDNGGYRYFFGADWPQNPPYSKFVEAYKAIGCIEQSKDLARVVATFPFDSPHLKETARKKYMEDNYDKDKFEVSGWGDALCGDEEVWDKLAKYYLHNKNDFT